MSTESSHVFDAIVIGGGTAGITAAREIARRRRRVVLIEADRTGGDCLYTGCVPSKSLIATARLVAGIRRAAEYGVIVQDPVLDFGRVMARKTRIIGQIGKVDSPEALEAAGVSVVTGNARFLDSNTVAVGGRKMQSRRIVIATGSRPAIPPIPGLKSAGYLTNEEILSLSRLPSRLAVIGAGPIGLELGQVFLRFGSQVTVIEQANRVLSRDDHEVASVLGRTLAEEGLELIVGRAVTGVERAGASKRLHIASIENVTQMVEVDEILVATGRTPNIEDLDLAAAGIETGPTGIRVDRRMRTSAKHIFACGDVVGPPFFTHVAEDQARTVAAGVLGHRSNWNGRGVPWVTFTDPEVAGVGMTEAAAKERYGNKLEVLRLPFEYVDRAMTEGVATGLIKVLLAPGWARGHIGGEIVGAHIVGANAGEMIQQFAFQIAWRLPAGLLAKTVQAYPTYSLGGRQAIGLHWTSDPKRDHASD